MVNEVRHMLEYEVNPVHLRRTLFSTSICFDASVDEVFLPLCCGGTIVIARDLLQLCERKFDDITLLNGTPSAMQAVIEAGCIPPSTKVVILGGEACTHHQIDALYGFSL